MMNRNDCEHSESHCLCADMISAHTTHGKKRSQAVENQLHEIILRVCDMRSSKICVEHRLIPEIISRWNDLKAEQDEKNKNCGHLFNPLRFIPIGETTHSRLLGDLLDPKGSHGQGRLLLEAFLEQIKVPTPKDGAWAISIEEGEGGRVDVCLKRLSPASVVVIENKSNWADDQKNQLYRYWHQNIYKPYLQLDYAKPEIKTAFQIIYLTPTAGKKPEQHSLQRPDFLNGPNTLDEAGVKVNLLNFREDITIWLDNCAQLIPPTNVRLLTHLQFYKELWT